MHASHVEAHSKMRQMVEDEEFNIVDLGAIENLRPCCANCNGDMRRFNMFNFLDRVGRFMTRGVPGMEGLVRQPVDVM